MQPPDNIIWSALTTRQSHFAIGDARVKRFMPEVAPFSAFPDGQEDFDALKTLLGVSGVTALFLKNEWKSRAGWEALAGGPLIRMVCETATSLDDTSTIPVTALGADKSAEMIALTTLARPGPFTSRTHEMGDYFGVYQDSKLVAMSGERMKVPGYTEVSAVCTHPYYTGRGYAAAAMRAVMRGIFARGETPLLHSRADNARAVALYERLGFRTTWEGHFIVIRHE